MRGLREGRVMQDATNLIIDHMIMTLQILMKTDMAGGADLWGIHLMTMMNQAGKKSTKGVIIDVVVTPIISRMDIAIRMSHHRLKIQLSSLQSPMANV